MLCALIPPFQSPDEHTHFYRAFQISEGAIFSQRTANGGGGEIEHVYTDELSGAVQHLIGQSDQKLTFANIVEIWGLRSDGRYVVASFPGTAIYSAIGYIPQAIGIRIARTFTSRAAVHVVAGRLGNLAAFVATMCLAMLIAPWCIPAFVGLSALPMVVSLICSTSQDAAVIGASALYSAVVLRLLSMRPLSAAPDEKETFSGIRSIVIIGWLSAFVIVLAKPAYLSMIFLMIAVTFLHRNRTLWRLTVPLAVFLLFCMAGHLFYVHLIGGPPILATANPSAQIAILAASPIKFLGAILETFRVWGDHFIVHMIGVLGWLDTILPAAAYDTYRVGALVTLCLLLLSFSNIEWRSSVLASTRSCVILVAMLLAIDLALVFLIAASTYVTWTPPGKDIVDGIQGRYWYPPVIMTVVVGSAVMMAASRLGPQLAVVGQFLRSRQIDSAIMLVGLVISQYFVAWVLLTRYYLPS